MFLRLAHIFIVELLQYKTILMATLKQISILSDVSYTSLN